MTMATLVKAWIFLVVLTLTAMIASLAQGTLLPVIYQAGVILAVAGLKASTVLHNFLGLRESSSGWRAMFLVYLVALCGGIFAIYITGCAVGTGQCGFASGGGTG